MMITERSLALFLELARDACNWSGTPILMRSVSDRGNIVQLKQAGLLTTFADRGDTFAAFTPAGVALAAEHGVEIEVAWVEIEVV